VASVDLIDVGVHFLMLHAKSQRLVSSLRNLDLGGVFKENHGKTGVAALENINLSLSDGEKLAVIGHNGAGKTTLLRVLATILPPTTGRVRITGEVSALMSIHLGLDPLATGNENIKYRARYMGHSEEEIEAQFRDIADFTELGEYLDLPLKSYSSGMKLRLAFAIATAFRPDVLAMRISGTRRLNASTSWSSRPASLWLQATITTCWRASASEASFFSMAASCLTAPYKMRLKPASGFPGESAFKPARRMQFPH